MKNPLSIFSKVFRTTMEVNPLTEAVTLEFCYDHVSEDEPGFNLDELLQRDEFPPLGIQEIDKA